MSAPATPSVKRPAMLWLVLGFAVQAGCTVEGAGLGVAQQGAGGVAPSPAGTGGVAGQGADGAARADGAMVPADGLSFGGGGAAGAGGRWGAGGFAALDGGAASGGGPGTGGLPAVDGAPRGGGLGAGGVLGPGGTTGAGGATSTDGPSDIVQPVPADAPLDGPKLDLGLRPDHIDRDAPSPDAPADARDASADGLGLPPEDTAPPVPPIWADEFSGMVNTGVDLNKWSYVVWPPGRVNGELQQYTNDEANIFHDGAGHLVIRALRKPMAINPYTSGRIDTQGKIYFGPGHRIEVRAKLPAGQGSFPGIVMMGRSGDWPGCGQLSLMEQYGQNKSCFYSTVRAGDAPGSGETANTRYDFPNATTASRDFHVYSVDWYSDHVVFQVDGNEILRSTYAVTSPLYKITQYLILDVAVGGDMGGDIDDTAFPMDMVIDYVRVYEL